MYFFNILKGAVAEWVLEQRRRKWRWAGHVVRRDDWRWTVRMAYWIPDGARRRRGRPATRWEDDLEAFAQHHGFKWETCARDRDAWESWESKFVDWRVRAEGEDTM